MNISSKLVFILPRKKRKIRNRVSCVLFLVATQSDVFTIKRSLYCCRLAVALNIYRVKFTAQLHQNYNEWIWDIWDICCWLFYICLVRYLLTTFLWNYIPICLNITWVASRFSFRTSLKCLFDERWLRLDGRSGSQLFHWHCGSVCSSKSLSDDSRGIKTAKTNNT